MVQTTHWRFTFYVIFQDNILGNWISKTFSDWLTSNKFASLLTGQTRNSRLLSKNLRLQLIIECLVYITESKNTFAMEDTITKMKIKQDIIGMKQATEQSCCDIIEYTMKCTVAM